MPTGGVESYFLRGSHPEVSAETLEEALVKLLNLWKSSSSLRKHEMGNLVITLTVLGREIACEVTDPSVLGDYCPQPWDAPGRPMAVIDYLAEQMGMERQDALDLLSESAASLRVDVLRPPVDMPQWESGVHPILGEGAPPPDEVLPGVTLEFYGELLAEEDQRLARGKGRRRSRRGEDMMRAIIRSARHQGISDTVAARRSGIPRSTLRDMRYRMEREERAREQIGVREPGQRFTDEQREQVLQAVRDSDGNASAAARQLDLSPRTVREIRQRARVQALAEGVESPAEAVARARTRYSGQQRQELTGRIGGLMVRDGLSATEAGRRLGVRGRTARGWVLKAARESSSEE